MPTMLSITVVIGANMKSSWSWKPFDPFLTCIPTIRNRTPLNSTCWPTGSTPLPMRWSTTVWPITATLAWEAMSSRVRNRPSSTGVLRMSPNSGDPPMKFCRA